MRDMLREKFSLGYGDVKWSSTWLKNPALRVGSKASLASVENALNVSDSVLNLNYHFL